MCDVKLFVWQCQTCQQLKRITRHPTGRLQPLPMPLGIWEDLSLDFIIHLPRSQGFTTIMVMVDFFQKGYILGLLPHNSQRSK